MWLLSVPVYLFICFWCNSFEVQFALATEQLGAFILGLAMFEGATRFTLHKVENLRAIWRAISIVFMLGGNQHDRGN